MKKQTIIALVSGLAALALLVWGVGGPWVFKTDRIKHPAASETVREEKIPGGVKAGGDAKIASAPKTSNDAEKALAMPLHDDLRLSFSPVHGENLSYRFALSSNAELPSDLFSVNDPKTPSAPSKSSAHLAMNASGDLFLKFFHPENPGQDFNVAGVIEGLTLTLNNRSPVYAEAMSFPFTFQMDAKGYLNDFVFTTGIPEEARLLIKTILYAMQTVYPKDPKIEWQTREIDAVGQYRANCRIKEKSSDQESFSLTKTKQAYLMLHGDGSLVAEGMTPSEVRIENSRIETKAPNKGAWILSTAMDETSETMAGANKLGKSVTRFMAVRQDKKPAAAFADDFKSVLSTLQSSAWIKKENTLTDPGLNAVSSNLDLDAALETYLSMRASQKTADRLQAEKFLVNYLRMNPLASHDLIRNLDADPKRDRFTHEEQLELWQLITKASHAEAQRAVLEAISNANYSNLTHIRAMAYIHDFEHPEDFMPEGLWDYYKQIDMEAGDDSAKELGAMTLYAIGSLGSDEKLNDSIKRGIGKILIENLEKSEDPDIQVITLEALANYGGADAIPRIEPYFSSNNKRVRMASFNALRRMKSDNAFNAFVKHYNEESSPDVKTSALKILTQMPATEETVSWASQEALIVDKSDDQESLAKVLGKNMDEFPESEEALRNLLVKNPSNRVKKEVYRYIAP